MNLSPEEWLKSTRRNVDGCVEVAFIASQAEGRDATEVRGPVLRFTPPAWEAFLERARIERSSSTQSADDSSARDNNADRVDGYSASNSNLSDGLAKSLTLLFWATKGILALVIGAGLRNGSLPLLALGCVLLIADHFSIHVLYHRLLEHERALNRIKSLRAELTQLREEFAHLNQRYGRLNQEYTRLRREHLRLQEEYSALQAELVSFRNSKPRWRRLA